MDYITALEEAMGMEAKVVCGLKFTSSYNGWVSALVSKTSPGCIGIIFFFASIPITYIDDIVEAIVRIQDVIPQPDPNWTVEAGSPATSP
jgi:hypothetical protein